MRPSGATFSTFNGRPSQSTVPRASFSARCKHPPAAASGAPKHGPCGRGALANESVTLWGGGSPIHARRSLVRIRTVEPLADQPGGGLLASLWHNRRCWLAVRVRGRIERPSRRIGRQGFKDGPRRHGMEFGSRTHVIGALDPAAGQAGGPPAGEEPEAAVASGRITRAGGFGSRGSRRSILRRLRGDTGHRRGLRGQVRLTGRSGRRAGSLANGRASGATLPRAGGMSLLGTHRPRSAYAPARALVVPHGERARAAARCRERYPDCRNRRQPSHGTKGRRRTETWDLVELIGLPARQT
jgi:hypothetical protein